MPLLDHEIPTILLLNDPSSADHGISATVGFNNTASGIKDIPVSMVYDTTDSDLSDIEIEIPLVNTTFGNKNIEGELILASGVDVSLYDTENELILENVSLSANNTPVNTWYLYINDSVFDIDNDLFLYSDLQNNLLDVDTSFRINIGSVKTARDVYNEIELAEPKYFNFPISVYCSTAGTYYSCPADIKQGSGRIGFINSEVFASASGVEGLEYDIFCTGMSGVYYLADIITTPGNISILDTDLFCADLVSYKANKVDIKTRSIFVSDFFINVDSYTEASSVGYVDIVDFIYPIVESSITIKIDGTTLSGIVIENIDLGKRIYFDPLNNFFSDGEIILNVYAESSIGEVIDEDFYLLYGYDLKMNEVVFWKPNEEVIIRGQAKNKAFCPNEEGLAYYFRTRDYDSYNLQFDINPVGFVDIPMSIYPQSTAFFYGKTYTVRVEGVKDFAGNTMPPFEYSFTIEDPGE
jgi:hypothetical protein